MILNFKKALRYLANSKYMEIAADIDSSRYSNLKNKYTCILKKVLINFPSLEHQQREGQKFVAQN